MKILFVCGRESTYTRNATLLRALQQDHEVINITPTGANYFVRHAVILYRLLKHRRRPYDLVFVGFYGQLLVPVVNLLYNQPILFDAFISTYQTLCTDRQRFKPASPLGRLAFWLDRSACDQAKLVLLDTNAHIDYFVRTFDLPRNKFKRIFVGADEKLFYPRPQPKNEVPVVFTYSEFQPLHGMITILEAAKRLEGKVIFHIVGKGQERQRFDELMKKWKVKNVVVKDWVELEKLPEEIAQADICLGGHFGNTEKAKMVIAGKTFQFIAMGKPTIVSKNEANRELLPDETYAATHGSPQSLALTIMNLLESNSLGEAAKNAKDMTKLKVDHTAKTISKLLMQRGV